MTPPQCRRAHAIACIGVGLLLAAGVVSGQQMPDPSQIHGKALPAPELSVGTVTVRVVREAIGNNLAGQQVTVTAGGTPRTATTDEQGRAEFRDLPPSGELRAEATVDGERLVSDTFAIPSSGGLRIILVAGIARAAERKQQEDAASLAAPPSRGVVTLGGNTRVLMQFQDDALQVFYVLEVVNTARTRIDIGGPIIIDLPTGAGGASVLEGSSPTATVKGDRLTITGPFAPGTTPVQVGFQLRYSGQHFTFQQKWPVALEQVTVGIQKVGPLTMTSSQLATTSDLRTDDGMVFLVGNGPGLATGATLTLDLANLPSRSQLARYIALALASTIVVIGTWLSISVRGKAQQARQALVQRRDALLKDLEQLELKRRAGEINLERYTNRRQRVVTELEHIYGELDDASTGPQGGGEGVAA